MLQYDVEAISRKFFGHEVFSAERSLNQPKARCVCTRSINQSNRSISVPLLFCFVRAFSFQGHTKIALRLLFGGFACFVMKTFLNIGILSSLSCIEYLNN